MNNITNYPEGTFNPDEFTEKVFIMTKELSNCLNWPTKRTWRCVKFKWESIQTEHSKLVEWLNFHCAVQSNYFNQNTMATVLLSKSEANNKNILLLNRDERVMLKASAYFLKTRVVEIQTYLKKDSKRDRRLEHLINAAFTKINTLSAMSYLTKEISIIELQDLVIKSINVS